MLLYHRTHVSLAQVVHLSYPPKTVSDRPTFREGHSGRGERPRRTRSCCALKLKWICMPSEFHSAIERILEQHLYACCTSYVSGTYNKTLGDTVKILQWTTYCNNLWKICGKRLKGEVYVSCIHLHVPCWTSRVWVICWLTVRQPTLCDAVAQGYIFLSLHRAMVLTVTCRSYFLNSNPSLCFNVKG